ncbi:MAG: Zn-binding domain-containing protein, partial [Planctomycetota bacterium]
MHGVARLLQQLTSIRAMCDPNDLDTFIDGERIYLYDLYPGGIGYSEVAFEKHEELIADVKEAVEACECPAGCPACVLPGSSRVETYMEPSILEYPYPKEATRFLIHRLLGIADYVPRLDGVPMATPEHAGEIEQPLDERTERKARKAIRRLGRGFSAEVG